MARPRDATGCAARGTALFILDESFSEGVLRIVSRDPEESPQLFHRSLSDKQDQERMIDGVRRILALASHDAFRDIVEGVGPIGVRGQDQGELE